MKIRRICVRVRMHGDDALCVVVMCYVFDAMYVKTCV